MLCIYGCGREAKYQNRCSKSPNSCPVVREKKRRSHLVKSEVEKLSMLEKRKQTNLQRFGVENPMHSKEQKAKQIETCLANYGVENPSQSNEIKKRKKETCLIHFGVETPFQSELIKEKAKRTWLQTLGVDNPSKSELVRKKISLSNLIASPKAREKVKATCLERYGVRNAFLLPQVAKNRQLVCMQRYGAPCFAQSKQGRLVLSRPRHSPEVIAKLTSSSFWQEEYIVKQKSIDQISLDLGISPTSACIYFYDYSGLELRNRATNGTSWGEISLRDFLASYCDCISNFPLERQKLDVYIPSLNLAFEYNGLYWHTEDKRGKDYHLEKTLKCEKLGIRLVHIWEDDWLFKTDLMKRKIKALLGKEEKKVFARKCSIIIPTKEQKREFYEKNHIKGNGAGSIDYALAFENELVAMITFKVTEQGYDLNRYATSCSVPGGFSRLLEHFKRNNDWKRIYTFADRSWSQGNVYLKNGFRLIEEQAPTFYGFEYVRIGRLNYTHEKLSKRFPSFKGTQFQIMDQAGIRRIWDCGQLKFEMTR
jgi:hypothetical protein